MERTTATHRRTRSATVTTVQDQVVVGVQQMSGRRAREQYLLGLFRRAGLGDAQAVGHALYMGVDRDGRLAEGDIEHHAGGFASDTGQGFQGFARVGDFTTMPFDQQTAEFDDVLGFAAVETDVFDEGRESFNAECEDRLWRIRQRIEFARRQVHRLVGRLRGQHHGDQQLKWRTVFEITLGTDGCSERVVDCRQ